MLIVNHNRDPLLTPCSGAPKVMASLLQICLSSSDHPNKYSLLPASMLTICPNCGLDLGSGFLHMLCKLTVIYRKVMYTNNKQLAI